MSTPLTSLCLSSNAEDLQPVQQFSLCKLYMLTSQNDHHWGVEYGELQDDKYRDLGNIYVRSDIARLLSEKAVTLVPSEDTVNSIWEVTQYNVEKSSSILDRRRCFDVLPIQPYQYKLVPATVKRYKEKHKGIPIFSFDSQTSTFQRFDYPYNSLPRFTLDVYPFHSLIHSSKVMSSESHYYIGLSYMAWTFPTPRSFRSPGDADDSSSDSGSICTVVSARSDLSSNFLEYYNSTHGILPTKRTSNSNQVSLWLESLPAEKPLPIPVDNTAQELWNDDSMSTVSQISFDRSELVEEDDESNQDSSSQSAVEL
ncbi:hypothetical protein BDP27DRAFT_1422481 [Rhodocollybia butyracea]|uniref:Uncharacterized protein n=1 Tax=Rhodocollybia butyracea TaxID=206335 RepID=A0A9P5U6D6_9AGAR|nr:hypothetical protein BDP27DRAFT_1422481 [Rhodocollybia butyracea]